MRDASSQDARSTAPNAAVLAAFFEERVTGVEAVSGGLSDAGVWRVDSGGAAYALRRTPAAGGDDELRVRRLGEWLRRAIRGGADFVAEPVKTCDGAESLRTPDDAQWTVMAWRPGEALSPERSTRDQLRAAVEALALFHHCLAESGESKGVSRAVEDRAARLAAPAEGGGGELAELAASLHERAAQAVGRLAGGRRRLQPVQVDCRPEHFLLTGDQVTGLVDFAAMRVDTPAVDVARLAGELALLAADGYAERMRQVVRWYNDAANLPVSAELVAALDLSGAVVSAENWAGWAASGRVDPGDPTVARRMGEVRTRLVRLAEA